MMKNTYLVLLLLTLFLGAEATAQVAQTIVVEHFTNTRCGICANRNPGFYANLNNQENTIHIAYHPSAPYSSCQLYQHNPTENDGRTNYYGVYGSTPKLTIQGKNIAPNVNYSSSDLFEPYRAQTSPLRLSFDSWSTDDNEVAITLSVVTEAVTDLADVVLFVALAEDTVFYNAPNGENRHYDVFRSALTPIEGLAINPGATVGTATTFSGTVSIRPEWNLDRIYPIAIVQYADDRRVVQAAAGPIVTSVVTNVPEIEPANFKIYPNPAQGVIHIESPIVRSGTGQIYSLQGQLMTRFQVENNRPIDVSRLPVGSYIVKLQQDDGIQIRRFIKASL